MKRLKGCIRHATCGDYRSIGIVRLFMFKNIDGKCKCIWTHPLYSRWDGMLSHGYDHVCEAWLNFTNFARWARASGYKHELWLERVNRRRVYSPANCRWSTPSEVIRNLPMTEKRRAANRRNFAKATLLQAAAGHPNLAKGRAVLAARREAEYAAIERGLV